MSLMMNSTVVVAHALGNLTVLNTGTDGVPVPLLGASSAGFWTVHQDPSSFDQFALVYENDPNLTLTLSPMPPLSGSKNYMEIILTQLEDPPNVSQLWVLDEGVETSGGNPPSKGRLQSAAVRDRFATAGNVSHQSPEALEVVAEVLNPEAQTQTWYFMYEGMQNS